MHAIKSEIEARLRGEGYSVVAVETVFDEAWTTDWIAPEALERLRQYGIAPPDRSSRHDPEAPAVCPRCGTSQTELKSFFGSTACKSMHFCNNCKEPFESFKCI